MLARPPAGRRGLLALNRTVATPIVLSFPQLRGSTGMFVRADLPNGVSLRPTQPTDKEFERMVHAANRWDLWLIDADDDFIHDLIEMQNRAQVEGYGAQFPNALYYIIEKTGTPCGRLVLDLGGNDVRIIDVAIMPEAQGRAIGTTVIQAIQSVARQIPAPVTLAVQAINQGAYRVYESLGFRPTAEQPNPAFVNLAWLPDTASG